MAKTILITGCSSGLGRSTAILFARKGWNVIATMRQPEVGTDLIGSDNILVTRLDVQEPATITRAIKAGLSRFGSIDVLVNNAGFGLFGIFEATPETKIREQFEVNVFGLMNTTRAMLPHFRDSNGGLILNVSSGAGVFTLPMLSLYSASKFAVEGFSESLSYELASQNIVVKIVEPGGIVSTRFGSRSGEEAMHNSAPPGYDHFTTQTMAVFEDLRTMSRATEQEVADVIFAAATDDKPTLRYVATDDIKPLVRYRRETSEEEYIAFMRSRFGGKAEAVKHPERETIV